MPELIPESTKRPGAVNRHKATLIYCSLFPLANGFALLGWAADVKDDRP